MSSPQGQGVVPRPKETRKKELRADFLLNFQRPPAHQRPQNYAPPPRRPRPQGSGRGSAPASFAKGRFVQSCFRILVDEITPDVVEATINADALLDWSSVRRVDLQGEERLKCPICLEEDMVVPKITRCGHVFCAPCVMRYFLALQEYNGKFMQKCPVCNTQQVSPEELISVRCQEVRKPREGDRLRFVLARRGASSTVVRPPPTAGGKAAGGDEGPGSLPFEGDPGWHLTRLARMRPGRAGRLVAEELDALAAFRSACLTGGDTELIPSIDAATKLLEQLRSKRGAPGGGADDGGEDADYYGDLELPAPAHAEEEGEEEGGPEGGARWEEGGAPELEEGGAAGGAEEEEEEESPDGWEERAEGHEAGASDTGAAGSSSQAADVPQSPGAGLRGSPLLGPASGSAASTSPPSGPTPAPSPHLTAQRTGYLISFYQADDGRLVFLQPFFTRLLLHEHGGSWANLPTSLPDVLVERLQEVTVSDETRKRHKFLSHLPVGSQICFAEVDLRNFLSRETKDHFADDFEKLRQQRKKDQQKSKREDRLSKTRAEREEEKYYQSLNRPHPSTYVPQVVPTKDDFVPLPGRAADADTAAAGGDATQGGDGPGAEEENEPTLADKLKERMAQRARPSDAGRGRGKGGAAPPLGDPARFPRLGGDSVAASSSGSAWGPRCGSSLVPGAANKAPGQGAAGQGAAAAASRSVPDAWDDDEDELSFGQALEAALRRSTTSSQAAQQDNGADAAQVEGDAAKKKKGRAGKATTIRLFG